MTLVPFFLSPHPSLQVCIDKSGWTLRKWPPYKMVVDCALEPKSRMGTSLHESRLGSTIKQAGHEYSCRFYSYLPQTGNNQDAIPSTNKPWYDRKEISATKSSQQPHSHKTSQSAPPHSSQTKLETRDSKVISGSQGHSGVTEKTCIFNFITQLICASHSLCTELLHQVERMCHPSHDRNRATAEKGLGATLR